ncbi:MAG: Uma2 family endonuclease [Cyclobacteriaceae bacterium]|nr:Uma2 family endonuclease [Cyclobacteriaceae bacterium HetDA_MAG_MS6]
MWADYLKYGAYELKLPVNLSDDELFELCVSNDQLRIERDLKGKIFVMSPSGSFSSYVSTKILIALGSWNELNSNGVVFDSSAGFLLPDSSVRAPDVAWLAKHKWSSLSKQEKQKFAPVCPDFVVEVLSPSDALEHAQEKMSNWIANGCQLAWLLDTQNENIWIYKGVSGPQLKDNFEGILTGGPILEGFKLDLSVLKD